MEITTVVFMLVGMAVLSVASGMVGLGVAFAAVPFLGLFLPDLVHQVQPLSLLLNGITAVFAAWGFARSGFVYWKPAIALTVLSAAIAPVGAWLAQATPQGILWGVYFIAVGYLALRLFLPDKKDLSENATPSLKQALLLVVPISLLAGLLGVGPGFLLMPALILVGYPPKNAAATTAVAVALPSFTALLPHISGAQFDGPLTVALLLVGATGSFIGARLTSRFVSGRLLRRGFGVLIVVMTAFKLVTLLA